MLPASIDGVMVPRAGVEPARPYGQRILRTLETVPRILTKQYEPVFTRLAVVKGIASAGFVSTRNATILAPSSSLKNRFIKNQPRFPMSPSDKRDARLPRPTLW